MGSLPSIIYGKKPSILQCTAVTSLSSYQVDVFLYVHFSTFYYVTLKYLSILMPKPSIYMSFVFHISLLLTCSPFKFNVITNIFGFKSTVLLFVTAVLFSLFFPSTPPQFCVIMLSLIFCLMGYSRDYNMHS